MRVQPVGRQVSARDITPRWIALIIAAVGAVITALLFAGPTWAADVQVSGVVTSANGPLVDGKVTFVTSCDYEAARYSAYVTNGAYDISLPAGTYRVEITPYGTPNAVLSWHNAKRSCLTSDPVVVSGASLVDLVAVAGGTLTGKVSSAKGPVSNAAVYFYESCADFAANRRAEAATVEGGSYTVTLRQGTFLAHVVPTGVYGALKSWHGPATSCAEAAPIVVTSGGAVNLVVAAGQTVTGSVASSNGPILEGEVSFYRSCQDFVDDKPAAQARFASGRYAVVVPVGDYRILVQPAWEEVATRSWHRASDSCQGADVVAVSEDVSVDLVASALFEISGGVQTTTPGLGVSAWKSCEQYEEDWPNAAASSSVVDGRYSMKLPPGSYLISIIEEYPGLYATSWHSAKPDCQRATPVVVSEDATVDLQAMPYVTVSGTVTGNGPVDLGVISLWRGGCLPLGTSSGQVLVNDGRYEMLVPVGKYRLRVIPVGASEDRNYNSWHNAADDCAKAERVTIDRDMTLDLKALPRYRVAGEVQGLGSSTVRNVYLYSSCDWFDPRNPGVNARGQAVVSDDSFAFGIRPGTYRALIEHQGRLGQSFSWHSGAETCGESAPVTVDRDLVTNLKAIPQLTVAGHVTGAPFGGMTLYETCDDFRANQSADYWDGALLFGRFTITVRPGTYRVLIHSSESEGDRYVWHAGAADCEGATPVTIDSDRFLELAAVVQEPGPNEPGGGPPGTGAVPSTTSFKQSVKAPRMKMKVGVRVKLARRTNAGSKVSWRTATPKKCSVRGFRLVAKRSGKCRVVAKASPVPGYSALTKTYRVRVKGR